MKFTDMYGLNAHPGILTVWRPEPGGGRGARWRRDGRPPSYAQEAHLVRSLAAAAPASPSWLAAAFELPGEVRAVALEEALLRWIDRHESLRSRLVPEGARLRRETLAPGAVRIRRSAAGPCLGDREAARRLEELFDRETDPLGWPSYVFATVAHAGSTTLYVGADHANVDGYSILLVAYEIRALYAAAARGTRADLGRVGSFLDFARSERAGAALVDGTHETIQQWRDFVAGNGGELPAFPASLRGKDAPDGGEDAPAGRNASPVAPAPACVAQRGGLEWLLDAEQARAFDALCRRDGGNLFAGLLACLASAGHASAGHGGHAGEFRTLVPFHTRSHPRWVRSVGWYVGLAPLRFAVRAGDRFTELMAGAVRALDKARPMAAVPFARVAEVLGAPLEPRFMVSYMDMRLAPGARQWGEWGAAALRSRRTHPHEVYFWINRTFEGIYLSFRYPDTARGRAEVPRYVDEVRRAVTRVIGAEDVRDTRRACGALDGRDGRDGRDARDTRDGREAAVCG
ncbi:hypothetical protein LE181_08375 [Streptomyces sp. SCA3-4]|uniref:condensation domain-containing protein n=1 Tax=Streptomyces sichuanensis TaxID=2871810 RepID=UPI001CE37B31|nr:condensation domain-containing protein [Streptomyces sichuanensis]MCA6092174.1 hypothetical protein [Streptomyces sichuanensis]